MNIPANFTKPPLCIEEQVSLLKERGVSIQDFNQACKVLSAVNYYRFCGYGLSFEIFENGNRLNKFKDGTSFNRIYELYLWDELLRNLLTDGLSYIEIAFRASFVYEMSIANNDPFWHLNAELMNEKYNADKFLKQCEDAVTKNGKEIFIKSYRERYNSDIVPSWILAEVMSFGKWSRLLGCIRDKNFVKKIAENLGVPHNYLISWIHSLVALRNRCAHQGQLWNRILTIKPLLTPKLRKLDWSPERSGVIIWIMADIMRKIPKIREDFIFKLENLLSNCPENYENPLGMKIFKEIWL